MFGVVLTAISSFFREISTSIGKVEVAAKKESMFTMGFLNSFWVLIIFGVLILVRNSFVFSLASLPTFIVRAILEIFQVHSALLGEVKAERTTFGFVNVITIPFLLLIDTVLGYSVGTMQLFGMASIFIALFILFFKHKLGKDGLGYVLFCSINSVATISLFKYNISHFNSVEAEQFTMELILIVYLFLCAMFLAKENPIKFLKKPIFFVQSATNGAGGVLLSFAYLFAPASVIVAAKRSFTIIGSLVSGSIYFHEKYIVLKFTAMAFLILGVILLV